MAVSGARAQYQDVCELCGGVGRTTQLATRRSLSTGENFDLVTGFDLGNEKDQRHVLSYIEHHNVMVVVMAPSCRALGPPCNLNYAINYEGWRRVFELDRPHLVFCG